MHVIRYGLKWVKKGRGYYQSTTVLADGRRAWLHRYAFEREKSVIPEGWHVHHVDGNKDNNEVENLECLPPIHHASEHSEDRRAFGDSAKQLAHLETIRPLAYAAKRGEYISERKLRRGQVRARVCPTCGKVFKLAGTAFDGTMYCSDKCRNKAHNKFSDAHYATEKACKHCGKPFAPGCHGIGHQLFCSESCRDKHRYNERRIVRKCRGCGESYELRKGDASGYCGACRESGADKHRRECAACGREVVSRIKDGNVFCDRVCANKFRRLKDRPDFHARYKQGVREGRIDPRDRLPSDL